MLQSGPVVSVAELLVTFLLFSGTYLLICCSLAREFLAELLGTFALVLFGDGAVAQVSHG